MKHRIWRSAALVLACLGSAILVKVSPADSLWDNRDHRSAYLFTDNRARLVGDLLTVTVREVTGAKNNEGRKLEKSTATSGKFNFVGKISGSAAAKAAAADVASSHSSDRKFEGSAEYDSDRRFLDQMTVTVMDVLPNGNLVVEGFRKRVVSNETRLLRVSGIVRPNDIDLVNSVESRLIANFNISYEGNGVESRFTNQGWLGRAGNKIWPW